MGLTDQGQRVKNTTDYRQNEKKKITDYRQKKKLTDYRHGPPLSIFVFRKKRSEELFVFFLACEVTTLKVQLAPDNSNLQGKSKKGSSYQEFELSEFRRK